MIEAILNYDFLQNALIAGILSSIVCGIIGVIIVEKKLVMMTGGVAHTAYGGVGLGYLLGFEPIIGAFLFAIASAFGLGYIRKKGGVQSDILIGLFWSLGMALGILFIALKPGYPPDMNSYLFGNILAVTRSEIVMMLVLTALVFLTVLALYSYIKIYLFDEEFSEIIGLRTRFLEYLVLVLIAITVVVLIRVVGIILVISLVTAPATIATILSKDMKMRMAFSSIIGIIFTLGGIVISYYFNIPSGTSIILLSVSSCIIFYLIHRMSEQKKRKKRIEASHS